MNQLKCEMCGGTELLKDNGVFVCQICGCKYSVEEAKKMMIEGTVDVSGSTVKIDNEEATKNYLEIARRAKKIEDWSETEKYYNLLREKDAHNMEYNFYSSFAKFMKEIISYHNLDESNRKGIRINISSLKNEVSMIENYFNEENIEKHEDIMIEISQDLIMALRRPRSVANPHEWLPWDVEFEVVLNFIESLKKLIRIYNKIYLYKIIIDMYEGLCKNCNSSIFDRRKYKSERDEVIKQLKELDPDYKAVDFTLGLFGIKYI